MELDSEDETSSTRCRNFRTRQRLLTCYSSQAKQTHGNIVRFAPPLIISESDLRRAIAIIGEALQKLPTAKTSGVH